MVSEFYFSDWLTLEKENPKIMGALLNKEEGHSSTRTPRFNGQYYGWWKNQMHEYIHTKDTELWDVILDGPYIPLKKVTMVKIKRSTLKPTGKRLKRTLRQKKFWYVALVLMTTIEFLRVKLQRDLGLSSNYS